MTVSCACFDYDWVIIGSGFGGSVAALRLAQKGYRVAVLEAGRRYRDQDFARSTWNLRDTYWAPALGLLGPTRLALFKDIFIASGAGVGGGSLVYANTLYRAKPSFFGRPNGWAPVLPKLNRRRALFVLTKIDEILAWGQAASFTLTVKGDSAAVETRLRSLPWVSGMEMISKNGRVSWQIRVSDPALAEAQLVPLALSGGGVTICEFGRKAQNLENVFLSIVEESNHDH